MNVRPEHEPWASSGWRSPGLWPLCRVRALGSPFILENRQNKARSIAQFLHLCLFATPKKSQDLRGLVARDTRRKHPSHISRQLFRKIPKRKTFNWRWPHEMASYWKPKLKPRGSLRGARTKWTQTRSSPISRRSDGPRSKPTRYQKIATIQTNQKHQQYSTSLRNSHTVYAFISVTHFPN